MMKKILIILITTFALTFNVNASSDGELVLKKNNPSEIKDCFESINRATFGFNQALDGIIFKPIASAYRKLPSPVKGGVSNSLDNLSNLLTIPNNIIPKDTSINPNDKPDCTDSTTCNDLDYCVWSNPNCTDICGSMDEASCNTSKYCAWSTSSNPNCSLKPIPRLCRWCISTAFCLQHSHKTNVSSESV